MLNKHVETLDIYSFEQTLQRYIQKFIYFEVYIMILNFKSLKHLCFFF